MKTHTVTTYTATELKEQFPDAFERALERHRNSPDLGDNWSSEIFDSLKAVCNAANVTLRDWSLGAYNRGNHIKVSFPGENEGYDTEHLCGKRAIAWLENNLFGALRVRPNMRVDDWSKFARDPKTGILDTRKLDKTARYYRPANGKLHRREGRMGEIPPCPLTGVCFDEDYLEHLRKAVCSGDTLKDAFQGLADVYARLMEAEIEYQMTEEYFIESAGDDQFTEDGERF